MTDQEKQDIIDVERQKLAFTIVSRIWLNVLFVEKTHGNNRWCNFVTGHNVQTICLN